MIPFGGSKMSINLFNYVTVFYRTTPTKTSNIRKLKAFFGEKVCTRGGEASHRLGCGSLQNVL